MKNVNSQAELNSTLSSAGSKLVVVDFFATWCGPCKTLAPILEGLERKHTSTIFAKVDVDKAQDCAGTYKVTAMPTILFFKNRSEVARVVGADVGKIQSYIKSYEGGSSFSGSGQTLGGSGSSSGSSSGGSNIPKTAASAGQKKGNLENAPYHVRLLTAVSHLSSGIISLATKLFQSIAFVAVSAKTGLIGNSNPEDKEIKTVEGPGGSCQIQVRMLDGTSIRGDFEPDNTLQRVRDFVQANLDARGVKAPKFTLMTNFPKTVYKDEALQQTLEEANLVGNPGVSKSTILNALGGEFGSGFSKVSGFTQDVSKKMVDIYHIHNHIKPQLFDILGIDDCTVDSKDTIFKHVQIAADALNEEVPYVICFVIKPLNGRINTGDYVIMKTVLDSLREASQMELILTHARPDDD
ncbi:hypothetical protein BGZ96_004531 [Linnemannia gamsii]|uniref:Uncharacterized protein n=1 Tax=Linnemannia gamsii TaxID=64522 RepID=A0ABQ7K6G2_9FUNG|nr:hypothetical protein BGZ96_004531 [Linnemannia gamsii]